MPMTAGDYLNTADTLTDHAMKASSPERESFYNAAAQATATQAVAAAIVRLAEAVENLAEQGKT
jgi:hemoglobin-like flavoprotein